MSGLAILGSGDPWSGGPVGERARCVLAPNPGPMTLDGTNTWILAEPGARHAVVVDPGPLDEAHLDAVVAAAEGIGASIAQVLLTHGHIDHSEGARALHERTGAPVHALDPAHRHGGEGLGAGDVIEVDGLRIDVVATPGHSGDCLSFAIPADGSILTGDTVLGRGTTVVAWPDGNLGAYLESLDRLRALAEQARSHLLLPGHGPVLADPVAVLDGYVAHRRERLEQVRVAWRAGADSAELIVDTVYADIPESVRPAALLSAQAQLEYLRAGG